MARRLVILLAVLALVAAAAPAHADRTDPVGVWPLAPVPEVVSGFHPPSDPWGPGHRGVDLLGAPGLAVRTALPGRISWAGMLAGRGVVVVDHGATRTTYEPVDTTIEVGTPVEGGDRIGRLSAVGSHCPPRACLHWGWIEDDTYLDPLRLVGAGPVRLLPLWREEPVETPYAAPSRLAFPVLPYAGWAPAIAILRLVAG